MKKKILLINAINPIIEVEQRYPNLGLGYLVSSLRKHFGKEILDFKIIDRNIEKEITDFVPDLVGISSVSQNFNLVKKYARLSKKNKFRFWLEALISQWFPNLCQKT